MQRLYSEFPAGCPGLGLLVLRLATSIMLVASEWFPMGATEVAANHGAVTFLLRALLVCGAGLLLMGLLTRIAGLLAATITALGAVSQLVSSITRADRYEFYPLYISGAALALTLTGPGGFSLDAWLFGPKRY